MDFYYVYQHIDPNTGYVVYVGHGCKERAWTSRSRSSDHKQWCDKLMSSGYIPSDWAEIIKKNIDKKSARELEISLINKIKPKFNKNFDYPAFKMNKDLMDRCQFLRRSNLSYEDIAQLVGVSTMTVHRALKGRIKSMEKFID